MLILGLLSILQIAFLPGYLVVRTFRIDDGAIKTWVVSFTMSLLINHLLVFALVIGGVYTRSVFYLIFVAELLLLAWMQYARSGTPARTPVGQDGQRLRDFVTGISETEAPLRWLAGLIVVSAAATLFIYLQRLATAGRIFSLWDAVVLWNALAVEWHAGNLPTMTFQYPQLLPMNFSISYLFIGNSVVQFFAKMIMPLFPLTILLALGDLGLRSRSLGLILSVSTAGALLLWLMGDFIDSGYADVPMACMAFASVYILLLSKEASSERDRRKNLIIGAVLSAGAALTKQPAFLLAATYPLLAFVLVLNRPHGPGVKSNVKEVALLYCISAVFIAPWYVFSWIKGLSSDYLPYLTGDLFHQGRNTLEQLIFGLKLISFVLGPILTYFLIPLGLFYGAYQRACRWLLIVLVVPWFFIWAALFSYDARNLALIIPLVGLIAGVGLYERFARPAAEFVGALMTGHRSAVALALLVGGVIGAVVYPSDRLIQKQLELQRRIGNERVNNALYDYHDARGFKGYIATPYQPLGYLPGLERYYRPLEVSGITLEEFVRRLDQLNAAYLLRQRNRTDPDIDDYIKEKIKSQEYTVILEFAGRELIELNHHNRPVSR